MASYFLTKKAIADLSLIWDYTFDTWSEKQADKYYRSLIYACESVSENPEIGRQYDNVFPTMLGFKVNKHIVFYQRNRKGSIDILRILHESMDLKSRIIE